MFVVASQRHCFPGTGCSAGYASPNALAVSVDACVICPAGKSAAAAQPSCTLCQAVRQAIFFSSSSSSIFMTCSHSCNGCEMLLHHRNFGSCPPTHRLHSRWFVQGYFAGNGSTSDVTDGSTLILEGASECLPCPPGFFTAYPSGITCSSCPVGTSNPHWAFPGNTDATCDDCEAG